MVLAIKKEKPSIKGRKSNKNDYFDDDEDFIYVHGYYTNPYESAILKLKEIPKLKSPVHKLKAITKTVELIHSAIQ